MNSINIIPEYVLSSIYAFGMWHA